MSEELPWTMTAHQICMALQVSASTLYRWRLDPAFPKTMNKPGEKLLWDRSKILQWYDSANR